jgi:integrase/recombinase XerD
MKFTDGVQQYVSRKHTEGIAFGAGEKYLTSLGKYLGDVHLSQVKSRRILRFLDNSLGSAITWRLKYFVVQRFFDFWAARGEVTEMLMPPIRAKERQTFLPHVYSQAELKILLKATAMNEGSMLCIPALTMRVLIILLYGTGARIGELLNLSVEDVNLERSSLRISNINPNRCRHIPIGADLCQILHKYLTWRIKRKFLSPQLFVTKLDKPVQIGTLTKTFRKLSQSANISRDKRATYQPRLRDIQYTFAVHRITSWIRSGADLNRLLPALAAYMGYVGLVSTERYLYMTPERFKKHLDKLSPHHPKRHWRNDKELMCFLASL